MLVQKIKKEYISKDTQFFDLLGFKKLSRIILLKYVN